MNVEGEADLENLHRIYSDARTWTHLPSGRFADLATTRQALTGWLADSREHWLGAWVPGWRGRTEPWSGTAAVRCGRARSGTSEIGRAHV